MKYCVTIVGRGVFLVGDPATLVTFLRIDQRGDHVDDYDYMTRIASAIHAGTVQGQAVGPLTLPFTPLDFLQWLARTGAITLDEASPVEDAAHAEAAIDALIAREGF